ncbi:uncharacterized protein LOC105175558 isoform X3 [Sesamum indicum]|uniref:Uncharacterized protein LOC105175558 isoform X3 n=1 Tax=Sesamum indicum TaxID=4182 RepID=A0A8M8VCC6_SESIN|nr:uncharacterized protein LOC105175558 isoform X3 [Sesamum indicum]
MQEFNESQRTNSTGNRKIKIQAPVPLELLGKMKKMALSLYPQNPLVGNGTLPFHSFNGSSVSSNGCWSKHRNDVSYNQLQKFWCELTPQARRNLLRIDKQTLFEHARKNMYFSRCNGLLLEGFFQIVMYGKSLQQDAAGGRYSARATDNQSDGDLCMANERQDDAQDPSVHPWGGLTAVRDGTLTLLDCYLYSKSLKGFQTVFDSACARERERELLYLDACGGGGRGWINQGIAGYGRGHGTRETCALHTARLSVETLVDFWSALGEETRHSLLRMKEKILLKGSCIEWLNRLFEFELVEDSLVLENDGQSCFSSDLLH